MRSTSSCVAQSRTDDAPRIDDDDDDDDAATTRAQKRAFFRAFLWA
jgi:hypothetical protein